MPKLGEVGAVSREPVAEGQDMATTGTTPERIRLATDNMDPAAASAES
jgi:hypothetical protein